MVALDAHGAPVTDLKREDFQVTDNGKAQQIVLFHHETPRPRAITLPPRQYSNRAGLGVPPAIGILFDLLNSTLGERGSSNIDIVRGLQKVEAPDHVYIYILTKTATVVPVRGVPQNEPDVSGNAWVSQIAGPLDAALAKYTQLRAPDLVREDTKFITATYTGLSTLGRQLLVTPGPKNVIWITEGVPITMTGLDGQFVDFTPRIQQLAGAFRRANIAINPVKTVLGEQVNDRLTLENLADWTGGRAYLGNDVEGALLQVTQNTRATYRIGYYPDPRNWDKKPHKFKVISTRGGLRLQYPQGYNADLAQEQPLLGENATITQAQAVPYEISDLGVRASLQAASPGQAPVIHIQVDPADLVLTQDQDHHRGQVIVVVTQFFKGGKAPETGTGNLNLDLTAKQLESAMTDGVPLADLGVNDTLEKVRIIVLDRASRSVGTLTITP